MFAPAPRPKSLLGYHRILSPSAGVRVSPICLGTMNFGEAWKHGLGECSKATAFEILDTYYQNGGNFLDTANHYQNGESETWVGEWMKERRCRDQMVLATKFTTGFHSPASNDGDGEQANIMSNYQGNHSKSLRLSLNGSLERLQTDYIDLLYVHWWDFTTSVEELMRSLHSMVVNGKVLYLGVSDTPAWLVLKCNAYARQANLTPFSIYQGHWGADFRDFERDILPMCQSEGIALAPWGSLGRGFLKPAAAYESADGSDNGGRNFGPASATQRRVAGVLEDIASRKGENTALTSVALAYVLHKAPHVFPVIGGRKASHLLSNIEALGISLSDEEMESIDAATDETFDVGFPMNFLFEAAGPSGGKKRYRSWMTTKDIALVKTSARLETLAKPQPIEPRQGENQSDSF